MSKFFEDLRPKFLFLKEPENGAFCTECTVTPGPKEAAFVAFQQLQRLDEHPQVREQLLKAVIEDAVQDPRPGVRAEDLAEKFRAQLREWANTEQPAPRSKQP